MADFIQAYIDKLKNRKTESCYFAGILHICHEAIDDIH